MMNAQYLRETADRLWAIAVHFERLAKDSYGQEIVGQMKHISTLIHYEASVMRKQDV